MRRSDLAALAPPGGAVGVALAAVEDAAAAAEARAAVFVDGEAVAAVGGDGAEHLVAGGLEDGVELLFGDLPQRAPGIDLGGEAGLALEDVADARGEALVEHGVAERARGVGGAELGDHGVEGEVRGEDVGAEAGQLRVVRDATRGQDAQGRAAELDRLGPGAGEHDPGRGPRATPARGAGPRTSPPSARSPASTTQAEVRGRRHRSPRP